MRVHKEEADNRSPVKYLRNGPEMIVVVELPGIDPETKRKIEELYLKDWKADRKYYWKTKRLLDLNFLPEWIPSDDEDVEGVHDEQLPTKEFVDAMLVAVEGLRAESDMLHIEVHVNRFQELLRLIRERERWRHPRSVIEELSERIGIDHCSVRRSVKIVLAALSVRYPEIVRQSCLMLRLNQEEVENFIAEHVTRIRKRLKRAIGNRIFKIDRGRGHAQTEKCSEREPLE